MENGNYKLIDGKSKGKGKVLKGFLLVKTVKSKKWIKTTIYSVYAIRPPISACVRTHITCRQMPNPQNCYNAPLLQPVHQQQMEGREQHNAIPHHLLPPNSTS